MSARKTVVRTTSANERPPAFEQRAEVVEHAARLRRDVAGDDLAGGRIERHLARQEQQLPGANGLRVRADRLGRRARNAFSLRHDSYYGGCLQAPL